MVFNLRNEVFRSCVITYIITRWGFHVSTFYSPDFKLHEVFRLYFTPFWVKIWSSHIFLDLLCNEELLINCAGVVNRLETCLSPLSALNLFFSFNHRTLKIINSQMFPLGVMYRRFPLTHEIIHGEFGTIEWLNLKYALTPLPCQYNRDKCFDFSSPEDKWSLLLLD
jgi:hypothetical protein